jgi:hypothetical protein
MPVKKSSIISFFKSFDIESIKIISILICLFPIAYLYADYVVIPLGNVINKERGKKEAAPESPVPLQYKSEENLFSSKLQILEELSEISFADDIFVSGLGFANGRSEISESFIRLDRFDRTALESLDLYVNGYRLVSPDSVVVEKFLSPAAGKPPNTSCRSSPHGETKTLRRSRGI